MYYLYILVSNWAKSSSKTVDRSSLGLVDHLSKLVELRPGRWSLCCTSLLPCLRPATSDPLIGMLIAVLAVMYKRKNRAKDQHGAIWMKFPRQLMVKLLKITNSHPDIWLWCSGNSEVLNAWNPDSQLQGYWWPKSDLNCAMIEEYFKRCFINDVLWYIHNHYNILNMLSGYTQTDNLHDISLGWRVTPRNTGVDPGVRHWNLPKCSNIAPQKNVEIPLHRGNDRRFLWRPKWTCVTFFQTFWDRGSVLHMWKTRWNMFQFE